MALTKFKFIKIKLDRADMTIAQQITAKAGAVNGNGIELQLVNGSIIENTTGVAVFLNWKHQTAGNQGSEPFTLVDATNGIYRVAYPTELLSAGFVNADIKIVDGSSITMTTQPILIKVAAAATDSTVQSANAWNDIQTILVSQQDHTARLDALETAIQEKAPLISPIFTGEPKAPTAPVGTNTTQIATTEFVKNEVAALVDSSPGTLDTLNELAAALGDDPNFATTMAAQLGNKAIKPTNEAAASANAVLASNGDGTSTFKNPGSIINNAVEKSTPVDTDMFGFMDSAAGNIFKKLSWANIKATLKAFFDTIYSFKSTELALTLSAASWVGSSAPYTYALTATGVTTTSNQEIIPSTAITSTELAALQAANVQDAGQAVNTINLKAFGAKPTVDIPIRVILRGDK